MKLLFLLTLAIPLFGQTSGGVVNVTVAPSGTCVNTAILPTAMQYVKSGSDAGKYYGCQGPDGSQTWAQVSGGGGGGGVTNISTTAPIAGGPITTTGTITCNVASASQPGCLSSADWSTFNGKGNGTLTSIGTSNGITGGTITTTGTISGVNAVADGSTKGVSAFTASDFNDATGVISLDYTNGQKASGSQPGFLSSTDWTTFNGKGSGTVTSVGTSSPLGGGTITGTGTLTCATCVTSTSPGAGIAHFAGSTQNVTSSAISLTADVTGVLPSANSQPHSISFTYDGGGSVLTAGQKLLGQIGNLGASGCAITGWSLTADQSGSISIDLDAHSSSAPNAVPSVPNTSTDKISASAPMSLSTAQTASGGATEVSTWTTSRAAWDTFAINVTGTPTSVTRVTGTVWCQ